MTARRGAQHPQTPPCLLGFALQVPPPRSSSNALVLPGVGWHWSGSHVTAFGTSCGPQHPQGIPPSPSPHLPCPQGVSPEEDAAVPAPRFGPVVERQDVRGEAVLRGVPAGVPVACEGHSSASQPGGRPALGGVTQREARGDLTSVVESQDVEVSSPHQLPEEQQRVTPWAGGLRPQDPRERPDSLCPGSPAGPQRQREPHPPQALLPTPGPHSPSRTGRGGWQP